MKKYLIVLLLALTSCVPANNTHSILANQLCGKLCWNNIVVGTTTGQELLSIITALPHVNQDSIKVFDESTGIFDGRVFFSLYKDSTGKQSLVKASAYTTDQKVVVIIFIGDLGIEFQDVVEAFGEPELVSAIWSHAGGIDVSVLNSSQGIEFGFGAKSEKASISPDTEINMLKIFDTNLYRYLLESNWLIPGYEEFNLYAWSGYGEIEEHYWPPR
mgnify:CR=1 FL=1